MRPHADALHAICVQAPGRFSASRLVGEAEGKKGAGARYPRATLDPREGFSSSSSSSSLSYRERKGITLPRQALVAYLYNFNVEVQSHVRKCLIPLLSSLVVVTYHHYPLFHPLLQKATPPLFSYIDLDLTGRILSASPLRLSASYTSQTKSEPSGEYPSNTLKEEHQHRLSPQAEDDTGHYDSQHCDPRRRVASSIGQDHLRHPRRCAV